MRESLDGLGFELLSVADIKAAESPPETRDTFAGNAAQKAHHYFSETGLPTVADDSGIIVEALAGELGVRTRRWGAGPLANDEEWIEYFLKRMSNAGNRRARFVCSIAHIDRASRLHLFKGICEGTITEKLESDYLPGLPISACFRPDGGKCVFSALSPEQKNRSSHRGKALGLLREFLQKRPL
ncbi:non-canonical purine NTP pyrophosphatase [Candidatus Peregrinibacteria bacterium]|nr:non-canonical purine NTP pyrophosphatase [Candidatus Peregrinibacteria bacterium]